MTTTHRAYLETRAVAVSTVLITALVAALLLFGGARTGAQSPEQVTRLAALGRVWGFLKYYHPGVAAGTIDWDSALVASVPKVRAARSAGEFRAVMQSLLDGPGRVSACENSAAQHFGAEDRCRSVYPDSMRINLDLSWLGDTTVFGADIGRQLTRVRDNRHRGPGRYVGFQLTAMFDKDTAFMTPEFPSEGVRLLALYRFWNAARYFFPYMYVNGGDWDAVLPEFIPRLIAAKDAVEYHLTLLELTTRLHDAHVGAGSAVLVKTLGGRLPAFEARSLNGRLVVSKLGPGAVADGSGLAIGDVITHIGSEPVSERHRAVAKYVAAGNPAVFERKLVVAMLRAAEDSVTYTVERDGRSLMRRVAMATAPSGPTRPAYPVTELARMLPNSTIGYINMGDINLAQVDSALSIVRNATGIVMDVRNYPRGTMYRFAQFFNPEPRPFVKFTAVDPTYPGQVVWRPPLMAGPGTRNADYFHGRVAILVDERTQSHAEFSVMALRTAPQNRVIGSQTAGADGNITRLSLPGGLRTLFTGLGVYYPDGRPTQRIGIVPDIEVRPTLAGLRAGRDEVLERALEYLRTGR